MAQSKAGVAKKATKRFFYAAFFPIIAPFIILKQIAIRMFSFIKVILFEGPGIFWRKFKELRASVHNEREQEYTPSFKEILEQWGVQTKSDQEKLRKTLTAQVGLWFILTTFGLFQLGYYFGHLYGLISGLCAFVPGFLALVTTLWKLSIIRNRQFSHFTEWAFGIKRG